MERLAAHANFANWTQARAVIAEVVDAISRFAPIARELGVSEETVGLIQGQLDQVYHDNEGLL
jgi:serine/threonine-protein kinase HipA